jgi:thiosulfate reductase cytochrome b subunit
MNSPRLLALLAGAALSLVALPARAQQAVNPIHPAFAPLDAQGRPVKEAAQLSSEKTCGACHDARYISAHTGHPADKVKTSCVECHVDGGRLDVRPETLDRDGRLRREAIRIGAPRAENCATCHGLLGRGDAPVALPDDLGGTPKAGDRRIWSLTLGEGAIVSAQRMADSFLNLEGKDELAAPWDVHAAKLVDCVACHFARNNPVRTDEKKAHLGYLSSDPRRESMAEFLVRPDHRLARQGCRACHDPMRAHAFLPYRERHMTALSCQACHASGAMAPAAEMVDATVATLAGTPEVRFRNVERRPGEPLNAATIRPFRPALVERTDDDGARRLSPVNPVTRWRWVSGPERTEVPFERVAQVFAEGGRYAPAILDAFDANRDGRLDERELRLDTKAKTDLIANRLRALGVVDPRIDGILEVFPVTHGVSTRDRALRDCETCHAKDSRVSPDRFVVASFLPGGTPPRPKDGARVDLSGMLAPTPEGGLALRGEDATAAGLHVLGHTRQGLSNTLGLAVFLAVFGGVVVHGLARLLLRRRRAGAARHAPGEKQYLFGRYERLWHWTMALAGVLLIATGLVVHGAERFRPFGLTTAVALHNAFAVVLMLNGFLALFYHLTTRAIRNFIPHPHGLVQRVLHHMSYQARGIFYGESHPPNAPGHKLNPLQQLTYLALLNVLFPLQIVTGALIWAVGHWPDLATALHGLSVVAPLHNAGAWLFLSFFVLHVYLVTTGRTATDHLQSMITGYGHLATETAPEETEAAAEAWREEALS